MKVKKEVKVKELIDRGVTKYEVSIADYEKNAFRGFIKPRKK